MSELEVIPKGMTDMQIAWAHAYTSKARFNPTKAAEMAGYANPEQAGRVCKANKELITYTRTLMKEQQVMDATEVLVRLTEHANATMAPFITKDGVLDLTTEEAQDNLHLIESASTETRYDTEGNPVVKVTLKTHSVQGALNTLAKHHNLLGEKDQNGTTNISVNIGAFASLSDDDLRAKIAQKETDYRDARLGPGGAGVGTGDVQEGCRLLGE